MATTEAQKAYNRAKTAKYRARKGKAAIAAQARILYHQHDDEPLLREAEQAQRRVRGRRHYAHHAAEKIAKVLARTAKRAEDPVLKEQDHQINLKAQLTFRRNHPERVLASNAKYNAANPEKINAARRARYAKNPEKHRAEVLARYALIRGAEVCDLTPAQWEIIKAHYKNRCVYCNVKLTKITCDPTEATRDHITPVVKKGNHTLQNIVPCCRRCNSIKGDGGVLKPIQPLLL